MKRNILVILLAAVFAFSFAFVGCKKDAPAPDKPAVEEKKDDAAAPDVEKTEEKKEEAAETK